MPNSLSMGVLIRVLGPEQLDGFEGEVEDFEFDHFASPFLSPCGRHELPPLYTLPDPTTNQE